MRMLARWVYLKLTTPFGQATEGVPIQSKFPPYGSVTLSIAPIYILAVG